MTAFEIEKEIMLQISILESDGLKPYIIEMPIEYAEALVNKVRISKEHIKMKYSDKYGYMGIKVYFGGKGINVCAKVYKS
jgi:hypothetical protein